MVITKKFIYSKRVEGEPKETDFSLIQYDLPVALNDGGLLILISEILNSILLTRTTISEVFVEAIYHSVDPYMRVAMGHLPIGTTMVGSQIAR